MQRGLAMLMGGLWALLGLSFLVVSSLALAEAGRCARLIPVTARELPWLAPGVPAAASGTVAYLCKLHRLPPRRDGSRLSDPAWMREEGPSPRPTLCLCQGEGAIPLQGET